MDRIGTRCKVFNGSAKQTSGGLTKSDLKKNKHGRIVSKRMSEIATKEKRLLRHGYGTKKGEFGWVHVGNKSAKRRKSRK